MALALIAFSSLALTTFGPAWSRPVAWLVGAAALVLTLVLSALGQSVSKSATAGQAPEPQADAEPRLVLRRRSVLPGGVGRLPLDALTHLPDREALDPVVGAAMREADRCAASFAIVTFDIDRLTDINGCHGFSAGDRVIRAVAERLSSLAPELVVRGTGDRFVMLLTGIASASAAEMAVAAALERISQPIELSDKRDLEVQASASAGISLYPQHGTSLERLLQHAEMAMVEAKQQGGRRCRLFDEVMITGLKLRNELERDLKQALENDQLQLHFQAQVELRAARVCGFEALMRWHHPERGWVPPAVFIPIAESSGLIRPIGAWLIRESCRFAGLWRGQGLDLIMALNISAAQLRQKDLADVLAAALAANRIAPERVELELTESLFVDPSEIIMRRCLEQVAAMGVKLAIDDFGTGYSSLAYLKRLPVGKIKIDKSFIAGIGSEDMDEALVRAIIGLARTFGKEVLAEGIETETQRRFLVEEGCDQGQGYLLARPMPFERCAPLLRPQLAQLSAQRPIPRSQCG